MFKPVLLLTILIFLITAPEPDAMDITKMTSYLLVADHHTALMASDEYNPDEEVVRKR